ncbi:hypothetical protein MANES_14G153631v8 [Manihot esculenta]|uniref:Uncharacterized protein n=1 Tax=Manihot esculenta TaxID=3983 RepID=A0ACB7GH46_MANES|nr:hypothetical protein MANES_14G153631v8 [Manihot esculenta]
MLPQLETVRGQLFSTAIPHMVEVYEQILLLIPIIWRNCKIMLDLYHKAIMFLELRL